MDTRLQLPTGIVSAVLEHAALLAVSDEECCGVVSRVPGGRWVATHAMANVAHDRVHHYAMDPAEQVRVWTSIVARGAAVGAIYHSHNHGVPAPSPLDLRAWAYDSVPMLIAYDGRLYGWLCVAGVAIGGRIIAT